MYHSRQCVFWMQSVFILVYLSRLLSCLEAICKPHFHFHPPAAGRALQLIPKDQLQRPRENHWAYLIQHWIKLLPLWEGNKAQFGPGGTVRARREVPCTSSHCTTLTPPPSWCCLCHHVSHLQKNAAFSYFAHLFIIFFVEEARSLRATGWAILVYCGKIA